MLSDTVISLLIQVPLVGAFIYFTITLTREFRSDNRATQDEMMKFIDSQNSRWQSTLDDERESRKESLIQSMREVERLAESIEVLASGISRNTEAILSHDVAAKERHANIQTLLTRSTNPSSS